jgi:hypothetical protein
MMPSLTVDRAGPGVDFDSLIGQLAAVPLAGRDDVAAAAAATPPPRSVLAYEHHQVVTRPLRRWYGALGPVQLGELHHGGFGVVDGLTFYLRFSVGGVRVLARDHSREYRREAVKTIRPEAIVRMAAEDLSDEQSSAVITEWSPRSRARMVEALASLDYSPMEQEGTTPGMLTLTYPARWQDVAPAGPVAKRHLSALRRRWARGYGSPLRAVWKLEFQRRGAPHFHLYAPVPTWAPGGWHPLSCDRADVHSHRFEEWLSWVWADIVGADVESGEFARHLAAGTGVDFAAAGRYRDHRRIGLYFLKHGTKTADDKEFQHVVPDLWRQPGSGPGRFWGFWGLRRTDVVVPVDVRQYIAARRLLRRAARARARSSSYRRAIRAAERQGLTGSAAVRFAVAASSGRCRTLGARGGLTGGWLLSSDGVRLTQLVAYWLALTESQ